MTIKDLEKRRQYFRDYYKANHERLKEYQKEKAKEYYWKRKREAESENKDKIV